MALPTLERLGALQFGGREGLGPAKFEVVGGVRKKTLQPIGEFVDVVPFKKTDGACSKLGVTNTLELRG